MTPSAAQVAEVAARFSTTKAASFMSILPQVAGPMLGGLVGRSVAQRLGGSGALSETLGTIGGMTAGRYLSEDVMAPRQDGGQMPPGAPYALDPSAQDIPMWAMQGARLLRPVLKQASGEGLKDVVMGDTMGSLYPLIEGARKGDMSGVGSQMLGQTAGVVGGGALGYGAGKLLSHMLGRDPNIPGVNIPLSTILSGLGATIGGVKGLQAARGS